MRIAFLRISTAGRTLTEPPNICESNLAKTRDVSVGRLSPYSTLAHSDNVPVISTNGVGLAI